MKRRIVAALVTALLPLGVTGCSIASKTSACEELSGPLKEAGVALVNARLGEA